MLLPHLALDSRLEALASNPLHPPPRPLEPRTDSPVCRRGRRLAGDFAS